jgi:hypothetical protein
LRTISTAINVALATFSPAHPLSAKTRWMNGKTRRETRFCANDIDTDLLGRLTNDDLKDIGVASFGHRKKLLDAIAALVATPEATARYPTPHRSRRLRTVPSAAELR